MLGYILLFDGIALIVRGSTSLRLPFAATLTININFTWYACAITSIIMIGLSVPIKGISVWSDLRR